MHLLAEKFGLAGYCLDDWGLGAKVTHEIGIIFLFVCFCFSVYLFLLWGGFSPFLAQCLAQNDSQYTLVGIHLINIQVHGFFF